MAIAFVNAASTANTTTNLTISKPTNVADGDVMIAAIHMGASLAWTAVPTGWNWFGRSNADDSSTQELFWKRASGEPTNYTWSVTAGGALGGGIVAYSGVWAGGLPIEAIAFVNAQSGSTTQWDSITTRNDGAMLVGIAFSAGGGATATASTATSPFTNNERLDLDGAYIYDGIQTTAGVSGSKDVALSAARNNGNAFFALTPAGASNLGPYTDSFTDSTKALVSHDPRWLEIQGWGSCQINTANQLGGLNGANYYVCPISLDQYSQAKIVTIASAGSGDTELGVRIAGRPESNGWGSGYWGELIWEAGARYLSLYRFSSNTWTLLDRVLSTAVNGDTLRVEAQGSTIRLLLNGVVKVSVTDTVCVSGWPGLAEYSTPEILDDWEGGSLVTSTPINLSMREHQVGGRSF